MKTEIVLDGKVDIYNHILEVPKVQRFCEILELPTRCAGAPFALFSKWRDGARVGRKEHSNRSRQPGVMCSAPLTGVARKATPVAESM